MESFILLSFVNYPGGCSGLDFIDIDTDHGNPQMCCTYASEFYTNLRAAEVFPNMLVAPICWYF